MTLKEVSEIRRATSRHCLKVMVASLDCMRHSSESHWSCLRSAQEENGERERWFTTTRWTRWRRTVRFRAVPWYR